VIFPIGDDNNRAILIVNGSIAVCVIKITF